MADYPFDYSRFFRFPYPTAPSYPTAPASPAPPSPYRPSTLNFGGGGVSAQPIGPPTDFTISDLGVRGGFGYTAPSRLAPDFIWEKYGAGFPGGAPSLSTAYEGGAGAANVMDPFAYLLRPSF